MDEPKAKVTQSGQPSDNQNEIASQQSKPLLRKGNLAPKDPLFKEVINLYFTEESLNEFSVNPGLQVGQTQLEIDVAIRASEELSLEEIRYRFKDTLLWFMSYLNLIEFKSINDKLDLPDFYRTTARALLAAASYYENYTTKQGKGRGSGRPKKKRPFPLRVISCLICASYPQSVQDQLPSPFEPIVGQAEGFYFHPLAAEVIVPIYLIVCNNLPLEEKYYPLLVFASGEKLKAFIELIVDEELVVYIKYVAKLHSSDVADALVNRKRGDKVTKAEKDKRRLAKAFYEMAGPELVADIGGSELQAEIMGRNKGQKQLNKTINTEELAQELGLEQVIKLLRHFRSDLSEEELKQLVLETSRPDKIEPSNPA